ncbi:acyl-CoA thioesterase [Williamwhitmania taraxaci]|uniref:Acyl-CoA thioester hydrolase n=1 Tax=Williamwhitmania taraxaci TaxID=1640674 RepID=A0A1G6HFJ2_9BACT|nr:thioesterase family protein [Williamwhitmania taraxaci]SDB92923.1 acyl-CoA thioester hydrolase [Williamwhitmania taraxaci]
MIQHSTIIRVNYSETDQMGYVHHSNYARYYETARWELFRSIGIPYNHLEKSGYMLPVVDMSSKFLKPALYDDILTIETHLNLIKGARINFAYRILNAKGELINYGETMLAFVKRESQKPCPAPQFVMNAIIEKTTPTSK